jgi:predicted AlkP superfamily phosphohydrolase/phosphomutase
MITGLLTPSSDTMFTYPNEIKARLHENDLGIYDFEQLWLQDFSRTRLKKRSPKTLAQTINNQMNTRATVALNLMKEIPWDFSMIVFRGTDTAQHFLFEKKDLLLICYQKIDELVGKIINTYPEATYFIISDHGFEQVKKIFYPDNILYNHHLLIPAQDPYTSIRSFTYWFLYKLLQQLLQILPQESITKSKFFKSILFSGASKSKIIDFSQTKAFSVADGRGIQICHNGLGESGIVREVEYDSLCKMIMNNLKETKDRTTKSPIIDKVYHWKEIYGDDALNHPDIVFDLHRGYAACEWIRFPETFPDFLSFKKRTIPTLFSTDIAGRSGDHAQHGIFFAYGKGIKTNMTLPNINVQDILPTIFLSMNINHPPNIDGSARTQIFSHEHILEFVDWGEKNISPTMLNKRELNSIQHLRKQLFLKKTKNI